MSCISFYGRKRKKVVRRLPMAGPLPLPLLLLLISCAAAVISTNTTEQLQEEEEVQHVVEIDYSGCSERWVLDWIDPTPATTASRKDADDGAAEAPEETKQNGPGGLVFDVQVNARPTTSYSSTNTFSSSFSSSSSNVEDHQNEGGGGGVRLVKAAGVLHNGRVCGVLGPSGSGKTTLLSSFLQGSFFRSTGTTITTTTTTTTKSDDEEEDDDNGTLNRTGQIWLYRVLENHNTTAATSTSFPKRFNWYSQQQQANSMSMMIALEALHPFQVAFLEQHDAHFELLTVDETLNLAAFLELPHVSERVRRAQTHSLLQRLGLLAVKDHRVGNSRTTRSRHRGGSRNVDYGYATQPRLSGGEKRRLSLARELITQKRLLVADEPTTGLDVALSYQAMKLIKNLTVSSNIPCMVSLHQPRSSVFHECLDDVLLLAPGGHVCYFGPAHRALAYFADLGFPMIPASTNPAEFLVDLVSIDTEQEAQAQVDRQRIQALVEAYARQQASEIQKKKMTLQQWRSHHKSAIKVCPALLMQESDSTGVLKPERRSSSRSIGARRGLETRLRRFAALLRRTWRQNIRNHKVNLFRAVASIGNAYLLALIFPTVRRYRPVVIHPHHRHDNGNGERYRANSVADRVALLSMGAISQAMMAYMKTADLFAREKPVVEREYARQRHYSAGTYLCAKVLGEVLFDATFAALFTSTLKGCSGVRISWKQLTAVYGLLTMAGASLGFAVGSWANTEPGGGASTIGIPILVILMVVGVINPSGVDPTKSKSRLVQIMQFLSPFSASIEALCLAEYIGMKFADEDMKGLGWFRRVSNLPRMGGLALVRDGDQVIDALGLKGRTFKGSMQHLGCLVVFNLVLSWLGLLFHQQPNEISKFGYSMNKKKKGKQSHQLEMKSNNHSSASSSTPLNHQTMSVRRIGIRIR